MKNIKIITHNGHFHADDVFSVALLTMVLKEPPEIIRTRDPEIIKTGDYVVDVGGVYDEDKNLFDHHQIGGAGERENGIPYSSFGLVWKKFGEKVGGSKEVADSIDKKLAYPIDLKDAGTDISKPIFDYVNPYDVGAIIEAFSLSWEEDRGKFDDAFMQAVGVAKQILEREIIRARAKVSAEKNIVEAYEQSEDKQIIILDNYYPSKEVLQRYPEPLYVIYPDSNDSGNWQIQTIRLNTHSFEARKDFPMEWAGKHGEELSKITGVEGSVFAHRSGRFIVIAKSKEWAVELAKKAVKA